MLLDIMPYDILYKWGEDKDQTLIIQKTLSPKERLPHPLRMGEEGKGGGEGGREEYMEGKEKIRQV